MPALKILQTAYNNQKGLSLLEVLMVVVILAILFGVAVLNIRPDYNLEQARYANARQSLVEIANAAQIYASEHDDYPGDVNRNIPEDFIEYISPGAWPNGPWKNSLYDWDNWSSQTCWDGSTGIIQITLRQVNGYKGKTDYTIYYVIEGVGIPHCSTTTTKGECINCVSRYP